MGLSEDLNSGNSTMHTVIEIDRAEIFIADNLFNTYGSGNVEIVIYLNPKEYLEKIYVKAKELVFKIKMEIQETFWGSIYARFEDFEGINWQLS